MYWDSSTDVLIAGAGPTGLMMACQLALHNVPFRIIDKNENHTDQSRALVVQARSLEAFDQMGIADEALRRGKITKAVGAYFNGKLALRLPVDKAGSGLTKFPFVLMLEQSQTESLLIEYLQSRGRAVERQTELTSLIQVDDEVIAVLRLPNGKEETVKTCYAIGADGAHSAVRQQMHINFAGRTYSQSLFVMDCAAEVDLPDDEMYLAFARKTFGGFFPLTNDRRRIIGALPPGLEGKTNPGFEEIAESFTPEIKIPAKFSNPTWIAVYHSHHRCAETFQKGRCFLAGDAGHIHSPVGGQGMNTGLQDAYNLAWKLALVVKKRAKESLLGTYNEERLRVAKTLVRTTDRVFYLVSNQNSLLKIIRLYIVPRILRLTALAASRFTSVRPFPFKTVAELNINYRESSLSRNASLGRFRRGAPRPGDRLPFVTFTDDNGSQITIHEKVKGDSFTLFIFHIEPTAEIVSILQPYQHNITLIAVPFSSGSEILYKTFGIDSGYYLIRPDMHIACRADRLDPDFLTKYLSTFMTSSSS